MTERIAEFDDPRLVAIFDSVNAYDDGTQPDFYRDLAVELDARTVIDLGCGTGVITCPMAQLGFGMIGVEPSSAMLDIARRRPGADQVEWICGQAALLGDRAADLAFMSGHVAQFFVTDEDWAGALLALHGALRPGGRLSFETRNPRDRAWDRWTSENRTWADDPAAGRIESWTDVHDVADGVVSFSNHYVIESTGDELVSSARLRFRSLDELGDSLSAAGFELARVYGDWDRRPAEPIAREFIVVAVC